MELGEKLRQARLEAGLSQRQLCGEEITRNMLSQIEHGTARPSMRTLQYLAAQLGKPVSFFLEETAVVSPNQQVMETARRLYDTGAYAEAVRVLEDYKAPDSIYDREKALLWVLSHLAMAGRAIEEGREIYAKTLLEAAKVPVSYCGEALERQRLLLLGRLPGHRVSEELPGLEEELMLRAAEALDGGKYGRAVCLLEAMEVRDTPRWQLLRGECALAQKDYREAAGYFHGAEAAYPRQTAARLEQCYRELQDFRRAYEYACKQKTRE